MKNIWRSMRYFQRAWNDIRAGEQQEIMLTAERLVALRNTEPYWAPHGKSSAQYLALMADLTIGLGSIKEKREGNVTMAMLASMGPDAVICDTGCAAKCMRRTERFLTEGTTDVPTGIIVRGIAKPTIKPTKIGGVSYTTKDENGESHEISLPDGAALYSPSFALNLISMSLLKQIGWNLDDWGGGSSIWKWDGGTTTRIPLRNVNGFLVFDIT
jgi:hypothetical protein